ncbi:NAD(P)-dependent oxidoreductase, partial [Jatrophihabitans endophyticus]|uniref:NAD(P)-dependent oxidoreductase n=1 Tax=Jatrophihabitans endophyticus TaxID=1206085 RepID=UPI0019FC5279
MSEGPVRALLLEQIHPDAAEILRAAGMDVETLDRALDEDELIERLRGVSLLGIRSKTQVSAAVLDAAESLVAVGAFCIGTNQIDLAAASARGVTVFNAPFSNTRSVVELAIAEIIAMTRRLTEKNELMHAGVWDKSATGAHEVRGRTLGIVGYGNIGTQLSTLAEAMSMRVLFYDHTDKLRHGNTEPTETLRDLLAQSDVVSLHVPETDSTANMIGEAEIRAMKPGAFLINNARGTVVDLDALAR